MKVTGWTDWEDNRYKQVDDMTDEEFEEAFNVVAEEIKKKGYKITGNSHQYCDNCCPVIDDKYIYCVSMRSWGAVMAEALGFPKEDKYAYCQWAWNPPEDEEEIHPHG